MGVTEILIVLGVVVAGSIVWLLMQIASWYLILGWKGDYKSERELLLLLSICLPVILLLVLGVFWTMGNDITITQVLVLPLGAAWIGFLCLLGLRIAARLRGYQFQN